MERTRTRIDSELLKELRALAAEQGREEHEVLEEAARFYLDHRPAAGGAGAGAPRDTRRALLSVAGSIPWEDLAQMSRAIEEGCERVDREGW